MNLVVRKATEHDVQALADLAEITFPQTCPPNHTPENIANHLRRVLSATNFMEYATSSDFELTVAADQGALVGFSLIDYGPSDDPDVQSQLANAAPYAELSKLYVHPNFHGVGVAQALRDEALANMKARSIQTAWLTVSQLNERANAFLSLIHI